MSGEWGALDTRAVELAGSWPPPGAEALAVDDAYERLADMGLEYGPAFQGLRAAWRRGAEIFVEVALDEHQAEQAGSYALHPALLDSALHAPALLNDTPNHAAEDASGHAAVKLPFAWNGVRLGATGASSLRVCVSPADRGSESSIDGALSLLALDEHGELVASVDSLQAREVSPAQLRATTGPTDSLFALDWVPVEADSSQDTDTTAVFMDAESLSNALGAETELPGSRRPRPIS